MFCTSAIDYRSAGGQPSDACRLHIFWPWEALGSESPLVTLGCPQRCCWGFRSPVKWHCVVGRGFSDVLKGMSTFIVFLNCLLLRVKSLRSFGNFGKHSPNDAASHRRRLTSSASSSFLRREQRLSLEVRWERSDGKLHGSPIAVVSNNIDGYELYRPVLLCPQAVSANRGDPFLDKILILCYSPCMFPQSVYFPTDALHDTIYVTRTQTPTSFGTQMPSSGSCCD
jgi:hypothetical protein